METETPQKNKLSNFFEKLSAIRERVSPEKEYILGAVATYLCLIILTNPESLPTQVQPLVELMTKLPMHKFNLWLTTAIAFLGSVDGARRMVIDQLPFYRAYLQVFLLNKIE